MPGLINGLHHVTAIASNPQENIDFYIGILGLRLVKKTVNFDAPDVYHFYYGDEHGNPGTLMTFFPYGNIRRGKPGVGQLSKTSFSVGADSIPFWINRFRNLGIKHKGPERRGEEEYLVFEDYDGLPLELVANTNDARVGWANKIIPQEHAIKGFHSVWLNVRNIEGTTNLLTDLMEYRLLSENAGFLRFEAGHGGPGTFVDIILDDKALSGIPGAGTVHHVAFSTDNDDTQIRIREKLEIAGYHITEVIDRQYFHSVYFREPGGVLFEIATNPPGFAIDEEVTHLGETLKLPGIQEKNRSIIEANLKPIKIPFFS